MMQQQTLFWHTRRVLALLGAVMLLALLVVAAGWGTARAAPQSGVEELTIKTIDNNNTATLDFVNWLIPNQTITLSYSGAKSCDSTTPLLPPPNPPIKVPTYNPTTNPDNQFQVSYTLPKISPPGTYYLCASDPVESKIGSNPFYVIEGGTAQLTPPSSANPTVTGTATTPGVTKSPSATSTPGNSGTSVGSSNSSSGALIAIIVLCLLVLALLVYLVRLWLRGRQPGGPAGGQQHP